MNKRYLFLLSLFVVIFFGVAQNALATVLDLSDPGSSGYLNGAFFSRTSQHGSGTGNLDPFVRIQGKGTEQGYNTDGTPEFDTKKGPWTHSLLLSSVPIVKIGSVNYYEFVLDAGEPGGKKNSLTIDSLKFYLLSSGNADSYPADFPSSSLMYNLDSNGDNSILLDNLTSGNGATDMFAYIPTSSFSGTNPFLYMYNENSNAEGSFEEWATEPGSSSTVVPEPASLSLLGLGLAGLLRFRKKKA